jgi:hypothetical protein
MVTQGSRPNWDLCWMYSKTAPSQKQEVSYPGQLDVPELKPPDLGRSRQLLVRRKGSIDVFDDYARKNRHDD